MKILNVKIHHETDEIPDLSYLGKYTDEAVRDRKIPTWRYVASTLIDDEIGRCLGTMKRFGRTAGRANRSLRSAYHREFREHLGMARIVVDKL